ncbi:homoserine kinase [Marivibrio halodurans]|uniref:Homoserine kinase n=1 Tax=Marivibrio halodurans TaxID=2039722 RepID=A0A8J7V3H5_9PROT|nr:homoserine kinase [Marivibrio halodurans]MBP5858360.1 homoserine kinase [Marivibrio halodurans]
MAVYTEVSDEEMRSFIAEYDIGDLVSAKGIAEGVENSNYLIRTTRDSYILTLYEKRVREEDLPFFLGLMDHLSSRDIPCPEPLRGRDGEALRRLAGRPAAIITFLEGMWTRKVRGVHCAELGQGLAHFHAAGADFPLYRANALGPDGWRPLYEMSAERAHEVDPNLGPLIEDELDALEADWPTGLPEGLIHADLFPDNVFFMGDRLSGLIDFYFACNDFLAYDLAICLNAWCFERDRSFNITKARQFLDAYTGERPMTAAELEALPILCRGAAMRFLLTRLYDWLNCPPGALVKPKDPLEYVAYLQFHRGVEGRSGYGLG